MTRELPDVARTAAQRLARFNPGAVVGVISGDEHALAGAGHTVATDGPLPGGDTLFDIGSITKVFTAQVLAELIEAGDVELETPVGTLIPELSQRLITLLQLATHTSGLPRSPRRAADWRDQDPYSRLTADEVVRAAARAQLGSSKMRYSNLGVSVLGIFLQRAVGAADYDTLLEPLRDALGLPDTRVSPREDVAMAQDYRWRDRAAMPWHLRGMVACGGLRSTGEEMLRFLRVHLEGVTPAVRNMQQERARRGRDRIGLGWFMFDDPNGRAFWHNGGTGRCITDVQVVGGGGRGRSSAFRAFVSVPGVR